MLLVVSELVTNVVRHSPHSAVSDIALSLAGGNLVICPGACLVLQCGVGCPGTAELVRPCGRTSSRVTSGGRVV
ncbi:hypothetical protein GCM10010295_62730 [Streptomyces intermedius]